MDENIKEHEEPIAWIAPKPEPDDSVKAKVEEFYRMMEKRVYHCPGASGRRD